MSHPITVESIVQVPAEKAWNLFTNPEHITKWNTASPDWHSPRADNNFHVGGKFNYRMEAKDGSEGFDFEGTYTEVEEPKRFAYTMSDGRQVVVTFEDADGTTRIIETFDPETENPPEFQKAGWQAILDNFKQYAESR